MLSKNSTKIKLTEKVVLQKIGDEAVILNLDTQEYYALNPSGLFILDKLINSDTYEQALALIIDYYDATPTELQQDINVLIDDLSQQGLIERL